MIQLDSLRYLSKAALYSAENWRSVYAEPNLHFVFCDKTDMI